MSMNPLTKIVTICIALLLLMSGCSLQAVYPQPKVQAAVRETVYEDMLGKSVTDRFIADFLASNHCTGENQFRLCMETGLALWLDANQVVETVYLYVNNWDGFAPYKGELPFGLKFYDTMGAVEYKLKRQGVGIAGRPDYGQTPDYMHYRAVYKQAGMTVIYNSPFVDEDATIYAVLIHK